eukprot:gb/GECG01003352.1/.p1 GENE.gb/GECG01003352.1/~~gb/GECG01003352.1/.p1  ORF type:complete len:317 (+),score=50.81 gb/GECG01003352.1/:1-951(+)
MTRQSRMLFEQAKKCRDVLEELNQFSENSSLFAAKTVIQFKLKIKLDELDFDEALRELKEILSIRKDSNDGKTEQKNALLPWETIIETVCLPCCLCTTGEQLERFTSLISQEFSGNSQLSSLQHCIIVSIMRNEKFQDMESLGKVVASVVEEMRTCSSVDTTTRRSWQTLLWNMAYEGYEESDFVACQKWSKILGTLVSTSQQKSALYRLQASCALQDDNIEAANALANAAVQQSKDIFSLMVKFKAMVRLVNFVSFSLDAYTACLLVQIRDPLMDPADLKEIMSELLMGEGCTAHHIALAAHGMCFMIVDPLNRS